MSKKDKRLKKIGNNPKTVSFSDLVSVLTDYGFNLVSVTGTHHTYKVGSHRITVPYRRPFVKEHYVKAALEMFEAIDEEQGDN